MEKEQEYYGKIYDRAILSDRDGFVDYMTRDKIPFDDVITNEIIALSGMDKDIVLSTRRHREISSVRQFIHYSVKNLTAMSLQSIADKYSNKKDHATILNSIHTTQNRLDTNDIILYPFRNFIERNNLK